MDVAERIARRETGLAHVEGLIKRSGVVGSFDDLDYLGWLQRRTAIIASAWREGLAVETPFGTLDPPACYGGPIR